tara:strand:- start:2040 stop:3740 length:1701 start_codon:yes stop_codon:yes gene_type:complete
MCGILLHKGNKNILNKFEENLNSLNHRGPDNKSFISFNNTLIGHTRLSIIDPDITANQPMISNCNNFILSFNGEIYNYKEIRSELIKLGYKFKTNSDSEVLLNGYIHYGQNILSNLEGIFAFIIYNKLDNTIFFARDHFGVKPLYYYINGTNLIISSELKVFKDLCRVDDKSKILFLSHGYIPAPNTYLKNVKILLPGQFGYCRNSKIKIENYFDALDLIKKSHEVFNPNLISNSVKSQMISDAKLGCFFSGGIDSSILTFESQRLNKNIETYSINFKNHEDESGFQKSMKDLYGFKNISKELKYSDFKSNINNLMNYMDSPTIDGLNTFFVSSIAKKQNAKVALSGLGADEIFLGYPIHKRYNQLYFIQKFNRFLPLKYLNEKYKKLDYLSLNNDYGVYLSQRAIFSMSEISSILKISQANVKEYLKCNLIFNNKINTLSRLERMIYFEICQYMEGQLLRNTDVFGMANSLEIRVPFLDLELTKNILGIDKKHTQGKQILIDNYKQYIPKKIYMRNKMGFELPYKYWLKRIGAYKKHINNYYNIKLNYDSHWSKIWALEILEIKY